MSKKSLSLTDQLHRFTRKFPSDNPFLWFLTFLNLIILLIPTVIILIVSFESGTSVRFPPRSFSLRWYLEIADHEAFIHAAIRSLKVATISTIVAVPVGMIGSYGFMKFKIRFGKPIQIYLLLPFMIPLVVSGVIFTLLFGELGIYGQVWTVGLALAIINLPFMLWAVNARVNAIDPEIENAAKNLGADEIQTFLYVTFPSLLPGIIMGGLIVFTLSLNEFIVSLLITTRETVTLPVILYSAIRSNLSPLIAAVSSAYILVAVFAVLVADRIASLEEFLSG